MVICWVLLGGGESGAGAAVCMHEDGVALDELAVRGAEGLLVADVAGRLDVDAVVCWDVEGGALG